MALSEEYVIHFVQQERLDTDNSVHPASNTWLYLVWGQFSLWLDRFFFTYLKALKCSLAAYIVGKSQ